MNRRKIIVIVIGILVILGILIYSLMEVGIIPGSSSDILKIGVRAKYCSTFLGKYQERRDGGLTQLNQVYCLENNGQMQLIPDGENEINPVKLGQDFGLVMNLKDQGLDTFIRNATDQICVRIPSYLPENTYLLTNPAKYTSYYDNNLATYFCFPVESVQTYPIFNFKGTCPLDQKYPLLFSFYVLEEGGFDSALSLQHKLWQLMPFASFVIPISK